MDKWVVFKCGRDKRRFRISDETFDKLKAVERGELMEYAFRVIADLEEPIKAMKPKKS